MKRRLNFLTVLPVLCAVAMATAMFTSCLDGGDGDEKGDESLLIGTWALIRDEGWEIYNGEKDTWDNEYPDGDDEITFMENGKVYGNGVVGSWTYSKGVIIVEDDKGVYETSVVSVLKLTSTQLVVEDKGMITI
jgi:hypothetical protein